MGRDKYCRPTLMIQCGKLQSVSMVDFNFALLYQMVQIEDLMFFPGKVESWIILADCS